MDPESVSAVENAPDLEWDRNGPSLFVAPLDEGSLADGNSMLPSPWRAGPADARPAHSPADYRYAPPLEVLPERAVAPARAQARTFNLGDRVFGWLTAGVAGATLMILGLMLTVLVMQSRDSIAKFGLGFLTSPAWNVDRDSYGAATSILGTVYTSVLALMLAAPVGILVAIFLVEVAPRRLRFGIGFIVELLAAVPSIVYGLWALFVVVPLVAQYVEPWCLAHFGNTPLFVGTPIGLGYLTASLILAIMILPTITSISRDVMLAVPNTQRDAMLALGSTRWEMVWKVVLPYARSGIIGAIILALGRAVGETMAVQMVIGNNLVSFSISLFNAGTTMPATIVNQFAEATPFQRSALIELALILMLVTILLNGAARLLVARTVRRGAKGHRAGVSLWGRVPGVRLLSRYPVRRAVNLAGIMLTIAAAAAAIVPLGAMLYYVLAQGSSSINLDFFTHVPASIGDPRTGMSSQIVGTLYLVAIASAVGLPIGILSGIYLARSRAVGFVRTVRFVTDVVAGTPSIVAGMVAYALVVVPMGSYSALSGGVALGLLMFPTVTRATEGAIALVPTTIREAALALGLPEWKTMVRVIIPAAANGIVTAVMLGIARVAGETAPLVFTAFGTDAYPGSPLTVVGALPLEIWHYALGPYDSWHREAWAGALVLFGIILALNLFARLLTYRLTKRVAAG